MNLDVFLYTILQILSLTLFEKTPLYQLLRDSICEQEQPDPANQFFQISVGTLVIPHYQ